MRKTQWFFLLFCVLCGALILIRYFFALHLPQDQLKKIRDQEKSFELLGIIIDEPDYRNNHTKYVVQTDFGEKILVSLAIYPEFFFKDKIKITGKFQTPAQFEDFNYKDYLLKDDIRTVSYYPKVELIEKKRWTFFGLILKVKNKLAEVSQKILPFPESELFSAMILGKTGLLPQDLKDNFSKSGLSHIVAISGMNITIIIGILSGVFRRTKLSNFSFYLISVFLFLYILLVGLPASAVRAGIMGGILILSEKVQRKYVAERSLILAAVLMLLFNPLLVTHDVGFQLSFLAVFGILRLEAVFEAFLKKIKIPEWLSSILAVTLSAQVFTLPIIVYNFGILSLISPIANIFVVPLLPAIMIIGFFGLFFGLFSTSLGVFLAFPLYLILSFTIWVAEFSANLSFSFIKIENLNFFWIVEIYAAILILVWKFKFRKPNLDNLPGNLYK